MEHTPYSQIERGTFLIATPDIDAGCVRMGDRHCLLSRFARLGKDAALALSHSLLHHSGWNVGLHRVRRLAHSLKRDIARTAPHR